MTYRISINNFSIVCPQAAVLPWVDFLLDQGHAPNVIAMSASVERKTP